MVYPGRNVHAVLSEFEATNGVKQTLEQRLRLIEFVRRQYEVGRYLREIAELTGRTQTAVRRVLDAAGVRRRGAGAQSLTKDDDPKALPMAVRHRDAQPKGRG